jgi:two-component system LytT family response regulator
MQVGGGGKDRPHLADKTGPMSTRGDGPPLIEVLIVEGDPLTRDRLRRLVQGESDLRLLGECANGRDAIAVIRERRPGLIFLDVHMPDMSGFDVVEALPAGQRPAVVFVSAYDEFAVRAFEVRALDYLLEPVDRPRFADALARARAQIAASTHPAMAPVTSLLEEIRSHQRTLERMIHRHGRSWPERLVVRSGQGLTFVRVRDVDWISSADNYVELHVGSAVHLLRETLSSTESRLDPERFVRIRRDAIVNLGRVRSVRPSAAGIPEIVLQDGTTLRLGRAYRARVTKRWQGVGSDPDL